MPAVAKDSKVLLTGGTGFLGAWILKTLLEQGFSVRAAVRNQSKADHIKKQFLSYAENSKLEFTFVSDITTPNAFDDAVQDVAGIIHAASPISNADPSTDPQELIVPAVEGTLGILRSAKKSPSIQRVVITSSGSAVFEPKPPPYTYSENDWNNASVKAVEEKGKDAFHFSKYAASKTLSEKAAWKWVEDEKPSFDLVTIMPTFVLGEIISETTADIQGSNTRLLNRLKKSALENLQLTEPLDELQSVDVRDDALHHVLSLTVPEAGGNRFLSSATNITTQHVLDILNAKPIEGITVPKGKPELLKDWKPNYPVSREKVEKILGGTFRPTDEMVRDAIIGALKVGWTQ